MANLLLTDRQIQRLRPIPGRQFETFDKKVSGLSIRVSSLGAKTFFLMYRMGGRNRRLGLGRYPTVTLAEARQRARKALSKVALGLDPATEKITIRLGYDRSMFPVLLHEYLEKYAKRNTRSWKETERVLQREFARPWSKLPVHQIRKSTVNDVLDGIVKRGTLSAANHAFASIRKMFNWLVERGHLEHSPCVGMKAPAKVVSRERVLNNDEVVAVWRAAEKMGYPFGPLVQLLILTGQRRTEVGGMRWQEVNFLEGLWKLPRGTEERPHKSQHAHNVPLGSPILNVLRSLPRVHDDLIFPARGRDNAVSGYSKWKRKLDELSGVQAWTLHDLRRTTASGMAALGVLPHVVERILNHTNGTLGGVAGIYNRYAYLPEMAEALERWGQHLEGLLIRPAKPTETAADRPACFLTSDLPCASTVPAPFSETAARCGTAKAGRKEQSERPAPNDRR